MSKCEHDGCNKYASFGLNGKRLYCKDHKLNNAGRIRNDHCHHDGCESRANYNFIGQPAKFCAKHATDSMIEIHKKSCNYLGCQKNGSLKHDNKWYCASHAPTNAKLVTNKCINVDCIRQGAFRLKGGKARYCKEHKTADMIIISKNRCQVDECNTTALYGLETDKRATRCGKHAPDNYVNIIEKTCVIEGCNKIANCGYLFQRKTHCYVHRLHGHFRLTRPKCEIKNCPNKPYYTDDNTNYPKRCVNHKIDTDKNIVEKPCSSCKLIYHLNEGTDLCEDCNNFKKGVQKTKELAVKALLDGNNIKYISHDNKIIDGCSRYRPDFVIETLTHNVIVECDENQHSSYSPECELARMYQIFQDFGGKHVIFIRFNPDNYKAGGRVVKPSNSRYTDLIGCIEYHTKSPCPVTHINVIYLFYDGYLNDIFTTKQIDYSDGTYKLITK